MFESNFCKNCDAPLKDEYKYCPECGQKVHDDLNLKVLFQNTISNYFSIDARFFSSFIPLMFRPGYVARKFVEGKRLIYLHPAQYYLFVSVIFFFILSFKVREYNEVANKAIKKGYDWEKNQDSTNLNPIDSADVAKITKPLLQNPNVIKGMSEEERRILDSTLTTNLSSAKENKFNIGYNTNKLDSLITAGASEKELIAGLGISDDANYLQRAFAKQVIKFHKQEGGGIVQAFFDTIPIAVFFLLPIFAFILKLIYWRKGPFSYHLVFSFYYFSFLFIILGTIIGVNQFLWEIPDWLEGLIILYTFIYLWLSMKHFYKQGYFLTFFKSGLTVFVYMLFILPVALGLIAAASFMFY